MLVCVIYEPELDRMPRSMLQVMLTTHFKTPAIRSVLALRVHYLLLCLVVIRETLHSLLIH
jgi:hypothetical protein